MECVVKTYSFLKERGCGAQSVLEYAIVLAVVSAAFLTMSVYVKRAVQGKLAKIERAVVARDNSSAPAPAPTGCTQWPC